MRPWLRRMGLAGGVAVVAGAIATAWFFYAFSRPGPLKSETVLVIPRGSGVHEIAALLERKNIVSAAFLFKAGVTVTGNQRRLRAGEFAFPSGISARGVMEVLVSGSMVVRKLTIPEGITTEEALSIVASAPGLDGEFKQAPEEGELLPDTYHYFYGDRREELITRMKAAMRETLADLWRERVDGLQVDTPREAVILASIVERETALPEERPLIAAVFYNRLKRGMPLQSDPTVAYGVAVREGLPGRKLRRPLTRRDLQTQGEFNTYLNLGLPPNPIANPGRAAIEATLNPARTKALYFVADGRGGHVFARTLAEHNRNVRRWRRLRDQRDDPKETDEADR